ncbi:MAG TPA: protease pro-enzyme activation domain-containing protein, partial [Opitutaceae bacterium]|nr:protease pro-enzyme activation domain-containing protein [Opitutaceae bacterium]
MPKKIAYNPVAGSERSLRAGSKLIGPSNPEERIDITVRVRSRAAKLPPADKIGAQMPLKRHYMSREDLAAAHGATPADLARVKAFAARKGLKVESASAAERNVKLSGTVRALNAAFDVKLMEYAHPDGDYRGRIGSVHLPAGLSDVVQGVFGLDNRRQARTHISRSGEHAVAKPAHPNTYTAPQVAQLYDFPAGTDGSGECVGLIEFGGGYRATDLEAYFKYLGIAAPSVTSVSVDGV